LRTEDLFARFGGEEFMALFRGTNESQAITIAEKLREKVAQTLLTFPDGKPIAKMTVTIGIATWEPGAPLNTQEMIETLIKTADHCLYYGKRHGKNQVVAPSLLPE
jgi:diguanylate cyclase (GGDEF)-like protein